MYRTIYAKYNLHSDFQVTFSKLKVLNTTTLLHTKKYTAKYKRRFTNYLYYRKTHIEKCVYSDSKATFNR